MAAIDFPSSPTVGQTFVVGGTTWIFDGVKWTSTSAATGLYLPLTGGTMTGDLILNRDAVAPLQAATFEQVQARGSGANRIINGDMRIDQRNNGASGTAQGYTIDRWSFINSTAPTGRGAWQRQTSGAPTLTATGFGYFLSFASSSAYASAAGDQFVFYQPIEADMISDFAWGTSNAQPVTLSFWAQSSLTGAFSGAIRNQPSPATRSYPFTFTLAANTWTKVAITIPGDTAGTWVLQGNAAGLQLAFDLGCGSTFRGPANAWAAGNYFGANGSVNVVGTNGAQFFLTGVKLEIGSVATPFNRKSPQESLADCQRYYSTRTIHTVGGTTANGIGIQWPYSFPVAMRAAPTVNSSFTGGSGYTGGTVGNISSDGFNAITTGAATAYALNINWTASAEL